MKTEVHVLEGFDVVKGLVERATELDTDVPTVAERSISKVQYCQGSTVAPYNPRSASL